MKFTVENTPKYKRYYGKPWWPKFCVNQKRDYEADEKGFPWWWKFGPINWCYRVLDSLKDYIFDPWHWQYDSYPSFASAFNTVIDNIMIFITPWYKCRRQLLDIFANNGGKLLSYNRYYTHVRNRETDRIYYTLSFDWFKYTLSKSVMLDKDGNNCDGFIESIKTMLMDDKQADEWKNTHTIKEEDVLHGYVFTFGDVVREINDISEATPELGWCN